MWSPPAEFGPESQRRPALRQGKPVADSTSLKTRRKSLAVRPPKAQNTREMNSTQKQFSLNRGASRKQFPISKRLRGGLLAFGIGVGSLFATGCATNNPALNAFMNYGVAPVIAADAGRSQVIVNTVDQTNSRGTSLRKSLESWKVGLARDFQIDEYGFPVKAVEPSESFSTKEPFVIAIHNPTGRRQVLDCYISSDSGRNWSKKYHIPSTGSAQIRVNPGEFPLGQHLIEFRDVVFTDLVYGSRRTLTITQ